MRKGLLIILALLSCAPFVGAQNVGGARLSARANVVPYDDEDAIVKGAYRESPYYMELSYPWRHETKDSALVSIREIEVEKYWKDYRVFLNVRCGRACRVMLNGKVVGYGGGAAVLPPGGVKCPPRDGVVKAIRELFK